MIEHSHKYENSSQTNAIAIIGMAGQFPESSTLKAFWDHLSSGHELIRFFSSEELLAAGIDPRVVQSSNYVKAKGMLEQVDYFDAHFFGYSPREAECIDPQQRLMLQWAWAALEDAGYDPTSYEDLIGVFVSSSLSSYFFLNLFSHLYGSRGGSQDEMLMVMGNEKDFLATRISYKLNLRGPSKTIQTACSSSLVSVHDACKSLMNYECDMAIAGGVSVSFPQNSGYFYSNEGINSPDGHCRAYDHKAAGTLIGNGGGIVVLKRLSEALAEGDTIRAVIKGSAVNNDGAGKVGYTAPSIEGQAYVIASAHLAAGVNPQTISYIEGHGTGTILGDPVEVAALTSAFRVQTQAKQFCAIGSVKTNIGHLDAAAGIAGLIKTVLCLEHKQIVPSLHFEKPNPGMSLDKSPFYVNTDLANWKRVNGPLRAGVSSFGIGGTNVHVILEEAPVSDELPSSKPHYLLPFSAKTPDALRDILRSFADIILETPYLLADIAYTLQVGRKSLDHRTCFFCRNKEEAKMQVDKYLAGITSEFKVSSQSPECLLALQWLKRDIVNWASLYKFEKRKRVPLPTYPFEKKRYLIFPKPLLGTISDTDYPAIKYQTEHKHPYAAAQNKIEELLVAIWENSLRTKGISIDDNFFALGGDSLLALEVVEALRKTFHINITLQQLFEHTSIRAIALFVKEEIIKKVPELSDEEANILLEIL